jgi:hypothetical protein
MPIGAAIGAVAGAGIQAVGSNMAANKQAKAAQSALALQGQMFDQTKAALQPYYQAGQNVLPTLQALMTPGQSAQAISSLPGFQFQSQWGTLAAQNALSAQGLGGSGGPLAKAISDYNNGLAGTYLFNDIGALQNFANMGGSAAAALGGNAAAFGGMMGQTQQNIGNAQASGILGGANAISGGLGSAGNALLLNSLMGGGSGGLYGGAGYNNGTSNYLGLSNAGQDFLQDAGYPLP